MLVGNKSDVEEEIKIDYVRAKEFADERGIGINEKD